MVPFALWLSWCILKQLCLLLCLKVWTSRPALWARRQWRRYDGALPIMHPGELDASSLSDMVGYPVAIVGSGHIGDGKMSTIARIDYVGTDNRWPRDGAVQSVICKSSPEASGEIIFNGLFGLNRSEGTALLSPKSQMPRLPRVLYRHDHWTGQYIIVMECIQGAAIPIETGLDDPAVVESVIRSVAKMHAKSLHCPSQLRNAPSWVHRFEQGAMGPLTTRMMLLAFRLMWTMNLKTTPSEILKQRGLVEAFLDHGVAFHELLFRTMPSSLTHGDLHCANIIAVSRSKMAHIDWQAFAVRPVMFDLCYLLGTSVPTDLRRRHENEWIALYYHTLKTLADPSVVDDSLTLEGLREQMRGCSLCLLVPILAMGYLIGGNPANGQKHFNATGRRALAFIEDHDLAGFINDVHMGGL
ncbi:CHK kinase-like domain-containing protein [Plasmodiophora brassicae]